MDSVWPLIKTTNELAQQCYLITYTLAAYVTKGSQSKRFSISLGGSMEIYRIKIEKKIQLFDVRIDDSCNQVKPQSDQFLKIYWRCTKEMILRSFSGLIQHCTGMYRPLSVIGLRRMRGPVTLTLTAWIQFLPSPSSSWAVDSPTHEMCLCCASMSGLMKLVCLHGYVLSWWQFGPMWPRNQFQQLEPMASIP